MLACDRTTTELLLSRLVCLAISERATRLGGALKCTGQGAGKTLTLPDTFLAAAANRGKLRPLDRPSQRDFPMRELQLFPLPEV